MNNTTVTTDCRTCSSPGQTNPQCQRCLDTEARAEQDEIDAELTIIIKNAVEDSLARNLSMLNVTMVNVANGHKTEMVDLHEVRAMHEATVNNLAMVIAELVRK